ncbi:hypothetical protein [Pseudomonas putida]
MTNEQVIETIKHLIGFAYAPAVKTRITELTGRTAVYGPGDFITLMIDLNRVHVVVEAGTIAGFRFG